ncbi:hypothetical protein CK203_072519 [Vitis vinifera]|uniref:Uncharacterized protein n=1 Tax=Vitis vinifera TaxID=29760 RepID=A0A438F939_VITVI|nr:hypothetical protein CK203_072519 [Vitis vinifera]
MKCEKTDKFEYFRLLLGLRSSILTLIAMEVSVWIFLKNNGALLLPFPRVCSIVALASFVTLPYGKKSSSVTLLHTCNWLISSIVNMFSVDDPNPDDPLVPEIAHMYRLTGPSMRLLLAAGHRSMPWDDGKNLQHICCSSWVFCRFRRAWWIMDIVEWVLNLQSSLYLYLLTDQNPDDLLIIEIIQMYKTYQAKDRATAHSWTQK